MQGDAGAERRRDWRRLPHCASQLFHQRGGEYNASHTSVACRSGGGASGMRCPRPPASCAKVVSCAAARSPGPLRVGITALVKRSGGS